MSDTRPNKLRSPGDDGLWLWLGVLGFVIALVGGWMVAWASAALAGHGSGSPSQWLIAPDSPGRWSMAATMWLVVLTVPVVGLGLWAVKSVRAAVTGREWTDRLASAMSSRKDLDELRADAVAADTQRLGSQRAGIGIALCKSVLTGEWAYSTYEWCSVWIMGPRAGKTRSVAVPQIVEHGGAVVATSNKRDIVYMTLGPRMEMGACWVFDPQNIFRYGPRFWVNLLDYVTGLERAEKLATIWRDSRTGGDLGAEDPFFGPEAGSLLTAMIMAAAVGDVPVTEISRWLKYPEGGPGIDTNPAQILRAHGYTDAADDIDSVVVMVPETRDGIFAGARSAVRWMRNPEFTRWVMPPADGEDVPQFSAADFVRSTQTIYLLSKDGPGSARALVGSMAAAIHAAGMDLAEETGDRVPVPVLFMLDEAANIVRWGELPSLYSYSGSLGLIIAVILQSRAQGYKCWGKEGFSEMWSAANVAVVGRGLRDEEHLAALAQLVGDRQRLDRSRSVGPGHSSTSSQLKDERILAESDLGALPRGRVVAMVHGARPFLGELVDYSRRRDAPRIEASTQAFKQQWMETEDEGVNRARGDVGEVAV